MESEMKNKDETLAPRDGWKPCPMEGDEFRVEYPYAVLSWMQDGSVNQMQLKFMPTPNKPTLTDGWLPIETMPQSIKDERTPVLIKPPDWVSCMPRVVRWKDTGYTEGWDGYYSAAPTHWMPLPAAPQPTKGE